MRRPHRVVPSRLQQFDPALLCAIKRRGTERAVVVVNAAAGEFDGLCR